MCVIFNKLKNVLIINHGREKKAIYILLYKYKLVFFIKYIKFVIYLAKGYLSEKCVYIIRKYSCCIRKAAT